MNKLWKIKDGVLGSYHINREGKEVDFRPCKITGFQNNGKLIVESTDSTKERKEIEWVEVSQDFDFEDSNQQHRKKVRVKEFALLYEGEQTHPLNAWSSGLYLYVEPSEEQAALLTAALEKRLAEYKEERIQANLKTKKVIEEFPNVLREQKLTFQQKRWLRRFLADNNKSANEVKEWIRSIPGGNAFLSALYHEGIKLEDKLKEVFPQK